MPVGETRGPRPHRIDHHQLGAVLLGLLDERPVMRIGAERIAGPEDDVLRVHEALRIDTRRVPDRQQIGRAGARIAEGALEHGGAELVEQRITDVEPVDDALGAEIAVRQDRLRAVLGDDPFPARRDRPDRFVPANAFELLGSLGADALHRVEHALVAVDALLVVVDLDAQPPARERMIRIAADGDRLAVLDGCNHRTCIRAVVWARADDGGPGHESPPHALRIDMPKDAATEAARLLKTCYVVVLDCSERPEYVYRALA